MKYFSFLILVCAGLSVTSALTWAQSTSYSWTKFPNLVTLDRPTVCSKTLPATDVITKTIPVEEVELRQPFQSDSDLPVTLVGPNPFLGVTLASIENDETVVVVDRVVRGTAAERAGIIDGDVIQRIDGEEIHAIDQLQKIISSKNTGTAIVITLMRNAKTIEVNATLGERATKEKQLFVGGFDRADELLELVNHVTRNFRFRFDDEVKVPVLPSKIENISPCERLEREYLGTPLLGVYANSWGKPELTGLVPHTGAVSSGLQKGDVVRAIDGALVASFDEMKNQVLAHKPGDRVIVSYWREGDQKEAEVILSSYGDANPEVVAKLNEECNKLNPINPVAGYRPVLLPGTQTELTVSPNPSNGMISLSAGGLSNESVQVFVADLSGRVVFEKTLENRSNAISTSIDLTNQPKGVYIVGLRQSGKEVKEKIILE